MKYLYLLVLFPFITNAQKISGKVVNAETNENVTYATLTIQSLKQSAISKSDGTFTFPQETDKDVDIVIDAIGYHPKKIKSSSLKSNPIIKLDEASELLAEIIIPPANAKISDKIYGRTNPGSDLIRGSVKNFDRTTYEKGFEFGLLMKNKGLSELQSLHIHIVENKTDKMVYRLQLYEIENGLPSNKINHQQVLFEIKKGTEGWLTIDLSEKNIFIDSNIKQFAATIKLVDAKFGSEKDSSINFNVGAALSNQIVARDSPFEEWHKAPFNFPFYLKVKTYK